MFRKISIILVILFLFSIFITNQNINYIYEPYESCDLQHQYELRESYEANINSEEIPLKDQKDIIVSNCEKKSCKAVPFVNQYSGEDIFSQPNKPSGDIGCCLFNSSQMCKDDADCPMIGSDGSGSGEKKCYKPGEKILDRSFLNENITSYEPNQVCTTCEQKGYRWNKKAFEFCSGQNKKSGRHSPNNYCGCVSGLSPEELVIPNPTKIKTGEQFNYDRYLTELNNFYNIRDEKDSIDDDNDIELGAGKDEKSILNTQILNEILKNYLINKIEKLEKERELLDSNTDEYKDVDNLHQYYQTIMTERKNLSEQSKPPTGNESTNITIKIGLYKKFLNVLIEAYKEKISEFVEVTAEYKKWLLNLWKKGRDGQSVPYLQRFDKTSFFETLGIRSELPSDYPEGWPRIPTNEYLNENLFLFDIIKKLTPQDICAAIKLPNNSIDNVESGGIAQGLISQPYKDATSTSVGNFHCACGVDRPFTINQGQFDWWTARCLGPNEVCYTAAAEGQQDKDGWGNNDDITETIKKKVKEYNGLELQYNRTLGICELACKTGYIPGPDVAIGASIVKKCVPAPTKEIKKQTLCTVNNVYKGSTTAETWKKIEGGVGLLKDEGGELVPNDLAKGGPCSKQSYCATSIDVGGTGNYSQPSKCTSKLKPGMLCTATSTDGTLKGLSGAMCYSGLPELPEEQRESIAENPGKCGFTGPGELKSLTGD